MNSTKSQFFLYLCTCHVFICFNFSHFHFGYQISFKPGFHLQQTPRPRHKKQSDYEVEQSSFLVITLFWLKVDRCRGRNWLYGNQAYGNPLQGAFVQGCMAGVRSVQEPTVSDDKLIIVLQGNKLRLKLEILNVELFTFLTKSSIRPRWNV